MSNLYNKKNHNTNKSLFLCRKLYKTVFIFRNMIGEESYLQDVLIKHGVCQYELYCS